MRQQVCHLSVLVHRQPGQHILEVGVWVIAFEPSTLNKAHHDSGPLACPEGADKQPVFSSDGNGPDLFFSPVVVDRQLAVIDKARERPWRLRL